MKLDLNELNMMKAGKLLDTMVADQVLGQLIVWDETLPSFLPPGCKLNPALFIEYTKQMDPLIKEGKVKIQEVLDKYIGDYSTDGKYAMQVIDRMTSEGFSYEAKMEDGKHQWRFVKEGRLTPWMEADTMAEAIAKASLVAIDRMGQED